RRVTARSWSSNPASSRLSKTSPASATSRATGRRDVSASSCRSMTMRGLSSVASADKVRVGSVDEFSEGHVRGFRVNGQDVAVVKRGERFIAFQNYCTHGAFGFDHLDLNPDGSLLCVGHGAYFNFDTGVPFAGPAGGQLALYEASVDGDEVFVTL